MVILLTALHYQGNDKKYTATQKDNAADEIPDVPCLYRRNDEETGTNDEKNPTGKIKFILHTSANILYKQ